MATKLDKDLNRESTVKFDDREVIVTLTQDQKISFKLKGMKSGHVSISIEDLYKQLKGITRTHNNVTGSITISNDKKETKHSNGKHMISLQDLRSHNLISDMDYDSKVKFESIITNLLNN